MLKRGGMYLSSFLVLAGVFLSGCAGASVIDDPETVAFVDRLLAFLANPNVAYVLLVLGLLAVIAELATPGATLPGVLGVLMLILSLYGLANLPTNWLGPVLIIAGVAMLLLDIKVAGYALSVGGIIAFLLGSLLIFTPPWEQLPLSAAAIPRLNLGLIAVMTLGVGSFFLLGIAAVVKAHRRPVAVGREVLIGATGMALGELAPHGSVRIAGEEWSAESATGAVLPAGSTVRVVGIEGLRLWVEPEDRTGRPPQTPPRD